MRPGARPPAPMPRFKPAVGGVLKDPEILVILYSAADLKWVRGGVKYISQRLPQITGFSTAP